MKKRFLSAALALAMALTLLPMSVMTASAVGRWDDGDAASYHAAEDNTVKGTEWQGPGWYAKHDTKDANGKVTSTEYIQITSGFVVGGKAYSSMTDDNGKLRATAFTVIGAQSTVALDNAKTTSVTVDLYGGVDGTTVSFTNTGALTSVIAKDSYYASEVNAGRRAATKRASLALPTSWAANKGVSVTLSDVTTTSDLEANALSTATVPVPLANSVTLTNASIGDVTLGGTGTATNGVKTYAKQTILTKASTVPGAPGNSIGAITVVGNQSDVNLTDTNLTEAVSITGTGAKLTTNGYTRGTGTITMIGSVDSKVTSGAAPSVIINGHSVGAIGGDASEELTTNFNVTVNSAGTVAGVDLENANVTVNGGTVNDPIEVTNGSVKIQNGATVGDITFGAGSITEFSVTGGRNTVGAVDTSGTFKLVNLAADSTAPNTFESLDLGDYAGHGVHGGKFETVIDEDHEKDYLENAIAYRVLLEGDAYTQYFPGTSEGLSNAIAAAGGTNAKSGTGIFLKGQDTTDAKTITLQNEGAVLAKIGYKVSSGIVMPAVVNGVTYNNWTVTDTKGDSGASYKPGQTFVATEVEDYKLDAQVASGSISKITNATVAPTSPNPNVTVKLVGNTITLSGAASSTVGGIATFKVKLGTDLINKDGAVNAEVGISWDGKKAIFDRNSNPGYGITFPDENTLRLENGATYTVSGSGLRELITTFTTEGDPKLDVTVTAPGYTTTDQKNQLIATFVGGDPGTTSKFEYGNSPAMLQAVNAAMATITQSQVDSWATQAQRQAWKVGSNLTPTEADLKGTGYTSVVLVPYLRVTITKANPLTATLAPYYRVEVRNTDPDKDPIVVKQGTALTALPNDLTNGAGTGGVDLTLNIDQGCAHQDGTYVYKATAKKFTFTHAGKTGLGTVVFDNIEATVELTRLKDAKNPDGSAVKAAVTYYYDSLQAAVDDTLPQAKDKEDEITVKAGYQGGGAINVSGLQRIFKITTNGNTTISASASADVKVTDPASGTTYTIQLLKDNVTTANIIVKTAENGEAAANVVNAKPGDKVTVTVKPKEGYKTKEVTATTLDGKKVEVVNNGNNTYSFNVPAGASRVDVTPVFVPLGELPFNDVKVTDAFYNAVEYCYNHNLINGTTVDKFAPYSTITRAQIVTILWRQAGAPTYARQGLYKDMPANNDYYNAIIWATKNGVAQGYEDGKFYPNRSINRQELATFLYRYQTLVLKRSAAGSVANLNGYTDGYTTGTWAQPAMRWAVGNGIITGVGNSLTPKYDAPRHQAATAMYQYCNGVLGIK